LLQSDRPVGTKNSRQLDVACNRCDRRGRLSVARLIAEHRADLPVPRLRWIVAADRAAGVI
jgi:hypothetical protein